MWFNFNSGELKSNEGGTLAIINLCDLPLHLFCTFEKFCIVKKFGSQNETGSYSMGTVINPHGWKWPEDIDSAKPSKYSTTKWDIFPGQNSMGSDFVVTSVDLFNYVLFKEKKLYYRSESFIWMCLMSLCMPIFQKLIKIDSIMFQEFQNSTLI